MAGMIDVPLHARYQAMLPAHARGPGLALLNAVPLLLMSAIALGMAHWQVLNITGQLWLVAGLAGVGTAVSWWTLFRDSFEQILEFVLWPIYRIRGHGPGLDAVAPQGPLLVLANHSTWFDPAFLAKVIPRRLTPMMTSVFYDRRFLRWWMGRVFRAIRVESSTFRREAPELQSAIAALDRGECVAIFPEGMLKRRAEQPLRNFGQGVWHILKERPATPVLVCWIEGGWGSYASYCDGPPTVNKRLDWWRRIDVAVSEPRVLDSFLLEDRRRTRYYLMESCLAARRHLGLEPLHFPEIGEADTAQAEDANLAHSEQI
jgi:1-acyl-sn-glycerol-3-phosphate acyltransferase